MLKWGANVACLVAAVAAVPAQRQEEVLVSAAASLSEVMDTIARAYGKHAGVRVVVNTGASNTLARQISAGARVDLFISADEAQVDTLRGETVAGTRVDLLSNQLAIAVPADRPRTMRSARELTDPAFRRVAIGDPAAVPAGVYAKAYLEQIGVWPAVSSKVVPAASVRLALAAVENGAADAAIVYQTDLKSAHRASLALTVPAAEGPRIVYPAVIISSGRNRDGAIRLLAWLRGAEAAAIFRSAGFVPIETPGRPEGRPLPGQSKPPRR